MVKLFVLQNAVYDYDNQIATSSSIIAA